MRRIFAIPIAYLGAMAFAAGWVLPQLDRPLDRFSVAQDLIADGRGVEAVHLLNDRVWRGVAEYRADRYRRAVEEFAQGDDITALYNLGTSYARLAEWAGARAAFERTLSLDPAHEDAAFNLALVLQAEELQRQEAEAQRDTRTLGNEQGNERGQEGEEDGGATTDADAEPSADAAPTDRVANQAGQIPAEGRTGDVAQTEDAAAGRGAAAASTDDGSDNRSGAGAIRVLRTSKQDTEILLRAIKDDPAAVLRARLWSIDQQRREAGR